MCGIVGVIGERNVTSVLIAGLKRLEYRGYDSAGVAVAYQGELNLSRAVGKLVNLEEALKAEPVTGFIGIGHTRWATHGAPTENNAHPHSSQRVAVVHNGIIENFQSLREELSEAGVVFSSDTDTEVIPHLIEQALDAGHEPTEAVRLTLNRLNGAFALGILIKGVEDTLFAARRGSPLIIGLGDGENFIGSDATPLVPYTRRMLYLQDDDIAVLTRNGVSLMNLAGEEVTRPVKTSQVSADLTDKWPHRHFMQKEIHEQPTVIGETLNALLHASQGSIDAGQMDLGMPMHRINAMHIIACGTSWHAGLVGKYWIEQLAGIPVAVDIASEYRYREPPAVEGTVAVVISQSGETADTLAAMRFEKGQGRKVLAIVNVRESTIAREADAVLYTQAGPEIGVASTKAFTTQLVVLSVMALILARARDCIGATQEKTLVEQLRHLPARIEQVLTHNDAIKEIAREVMNANGFLFMGRGKSFPIALEGALKLKEISYIHAEGYAAGEMKHGPIALIDEELPVVVVAPRDDLYDKVVSNMQEVKARGGRVILITNEGEKSDAADFHIPMVGADDFVNPILYVVPLQLLAYHIAVLKGTDVDQPRNLAKSVTVE